MTAFKEGDPVWYADRRHWKPAIFTCYVGSRLQLQILRDDRAWTVVRPPGAVRPRPDLSLPKEAPPSMLEVEP